MLTTLQLQRKWTVNRIVLLACLGLALATTTAWVWGFNTHLFTRRDAYDYAQLSSEFSQDGMLATRQLFPRHLPYLQEKGYLTGDYWPNLYRSPLLTITNAAFQPFFESVIVALVIQSGFWYLGCIPLLFLLANRLTNFRVAAVTTLVFVADPEMIRYSYSGMTESLGTFLLLALSFLVLFFNARPLKWLLVGCICTLAYLARAQFLILIPLVFIYIWVKAPALTRNKALLFFLIGLFISLAPWLLRNQIVTGDPLFSFTNSRNLVLDSIPAPSDLEMQLHAPVDLMDVMDRFDGAVFTKFFRNVLQSAFSIPYWANSFRGPYLFLLIFFLVALVHSHHTYPVEYRAFKWSTLVLILSTFLLISLTVYSVRSYLVLRPFVYLVAIGEVDWLLQRFSPSPRLARIILALFAGLAVWQFESAIASQRNIQAPVSFFDERTYETLQRKVGEETIIASDISEQISLFSGSRTIRLPSKPEELLEINQEFLPVDYILLSKGLWTGSSADEDEKSYHETYRDYVQFVLTPSFLDFFEFEERLPNGALLYKRREPAN